MKIDEIVGVLNAEMLVKGDDIDIEIKSACGADLMSDVMAYVKENVLLLTGLVNPQVVRTAEMMDIKAIAFVRGKKPGQDIIELANEKKITVLVTKETMFTACGKLYKEGITGRGIW
ncbi:MAG: DRTGG domain-containing protein [Clostridia bacterium]|jgi:predicted transcriptional regulator